MFLIFGGAVGLVLGSFLPWIKATAPLVGTITKTGTDGAGDGWLLVGLGVLTLMLAWPFLTQHRFRMGQSIAVSVVGLLAIVVAVWDLVDVMQRVSDIQDGGTGIASVGPGMYLAAASAVAIFMGGLWEWTESRPQRSERESDLVAAITSCAALAEQFDLAAQHGDVRLMQMIDARMRELECEGR